MRDMGMKARESLIRLKRFQVEERNRRVKQIEAMIADFERMAADLEREITTEEEKSGISDKSHFAYSTYARAAATRRENLLCSAEELRGQLDDARLLHQDAVEDLRALELRDDREKAEGRLQEAQA
jgi:flagellar export protein FliJ